MPIPLNEFERGQPSSPSRLILDFLQSNRLLAYSVEELKAELASKGINLTVEQVEDILNILEAFDRIKSKVVDGVKRYRYKALGFRSFST